MKAFGIGICDGGLCQLMPCFPKLANNIGGVSACNYGWVCPGICHRIIIHVDLSKLGTIDKGLDIQYIPRNMHTVLLCFVVVMQSFIMNSHEVFIHIHQGCFAGTGTIVRLPQCQWSKPDGYGKISQGITTTKHSKAKTVCIFLGIYCMRYSDITWYNSTMLKTIITYSAA